MKNQEASLDYKTEMTVYERLLRKLRNEDHLDALDFWATYKEIENPETIVEIINLMQGRASIVDVAIYGDFLQSITHETIVAFFDAIVTLPNLQEIRISGDDWEDYNPVLLQEFVSKLLLEGRKLTVFNLRNMDVGDEIGAEIVQQIQKFKTLEEVTLRKLNLGNKTAFAIADWLKDSSCCLERIYLECNPKIGSKGWEAIGNALENNFILKRIINLLCTIRIAAQQRCQFYLILNNQCNRNKMMHSAGDDNDYTITRNEYINNMIETSKQNIQFCDDNYSWEGSKGKLKLSLIYYWIRMNPSIISN